LTPDNVNDSTFGKVFTVPMDGKVDGQPLYTSGLFIPSIGFSGRRGKKVVYAATEHDSVYAFDAETGAVYWRKSILQPGETTSDAHSCGQVTPEIGITATAVIDRSAGPHGVIYVVGMSKDDAGTYHQRLHALDLVSGAEELGGPVEIEASYPGNGQELTSGSNVVFDPGQHEDRAALLLSQGVVYTSWTSHCDQNPYTGWVIGYNSRTLKQTAVFNFNPNGSRASIWNSGGGPAADERGNLFFSTANGMFDTVLNAEGFPAMGNYGNSVVKLKPRDGFKLDRALKAVDYWTMFNTVEESGKDMDLGSGGIVLLPDQTDGTGKVRQLAVAAGKDQNIYVLDRKNLGKFDATSNHTIYQELAGALAGPGFGAISWFHGRIYIGAVNDVIKAYDVTNARLSVAPSSRTINSFAYPGTSPVISADGKRNAILWALENGAAHGVLHAYDPANLSTEFYSSDQAPGARDQFGPGNKFISPMIANGHVYVGTVSGVVVFGLLAQH
jgi:outer membrane protein assembly factor BamB